MRSVGGIDLPLIQKYINFHYSICLDLFGAELSTNAATYFTQGLKGRFLETRIDDDHVLADASYPVPEMKGDTVVMTDASALNAINERLRAEYITDSQRGVDRWNKIIRDASIDFVLTLPHVGFNRSIGTFTDFHFSPDGKLLTEAEWMNRRAEWLPVDEDYAFVQTLMQPVTEPGKMANWIAPPARGINNQPQDFEYVRFG